VHRKLERGAREVVRLPLPAVLGLETGLAEPRYPALPAFMEALQASIPVLRLPGAGASTLPVHTPDALEVRCPQTTVGPPRPRPRVVFAPDYHLPPEERIAQILTAGMPRKAGVLLEGSPSELAARLVAFLRERGFVE
jgi:electron transfer flavoprotein beta subunit